MRNYAPALSRGRWRSITEVGARGARGGRTRKGCDFKWRSHGGGGARAMDQIRTGWVRSDGFLLNDYYRPSTSRSFRIYFSVVELFVCSTYFVNKYIETAISAPPLKPALRISFIVALEYRLLRQRTNLKSSRLQATPLGIAHPVLILSLNWKLRGRERVFDVRETAAVVREEFTYWRANCFTPRHSAGGWRPRRRCAAIKFPLEFSEAGECLRRKYLAYLRY
ncbi:hypothetical protein EVAR_96677_1 [Eumeta japonica]|uniref:Uncharacterized protein n=1 Tax=Eumeta variegata TaxID=151549 RepID=A0A4C1WGZ9_EUMVA|nr:hypothetical protein EVAR_96677_1 [Eumeta japonica]